MTLRFLILSSFPFTRNLRMGKNYTLRIFMLSGSIHLYSNLQFNMTCIYHKTYLLYQTILMLIHFHMLSIYLTQIMRLKHILPKMYLVYKSHLHSSNLLFHFVYTICIHDEFRSVNPVFFYHSVMSLHI